MMKKTIIAILGLGFLAACVVNPTFDEGKQSPDDLLQLRDGKLQLKQCQDGENLVFRNNAWECGSGGGPTCGDNQILVWQDNAFMCADASSGGLPMGGCGNDASVLYWKNGQWECGPTWGDCNDDEALVRRSGSWVCEAASPVCQNDQQLVRRNDSWVCEAAAPSACPAGSFAVTANNAWECSDSQNTNVGIGTNSPTALLDVNGDVNVSGDVTAANFPSGSSRRIKKNIKPLNDAIGKIKRINGVSYELKKSGRKDIGVIAEDVDQVLPEVVSHDSKGRAVGVDYGRLSSVLIEAVKAQQVQLEAQQKQLADQQQLIEKLLKKSK